MIPVAILLYAAAFSVFVFAAVMDKARLINWFLKSRLWTIGARLYMPVYLISP